MRRGHTDTQRESVTKDTLQIDFHEFIRQAAKMSDAELATEFHVDAREVALLRARLTRS